MIQKFDSIVIGTGQAGPFLSTAYLGLVTAMAKEPLHIHLIMTLKS